MPLPTQPDPSDSPIAIPAEPSTEAAAIESGQLLHGRSSVTIEHRETRYRLQETKAGKLILTK